jgi:uncharacterized protein YndB with AHSA1/START domain
MGDTTLAFVSRAPQTDIERVKARMGWEIPWYTMTNGFDADFGVDEWHGTNVFIRDGDSVFRTYFINNRGDEVTGSTWSYLDLTALGRQEQWEDSPEGYPQTPPYEWWNWHDEYSDAQPSQRTGPARSADRAQETDMAPRIEQEIIIDAPVEYVWRAVTEPEQIRLWFTEDVDLTPVPGYDGSVTFNRRSEKPTLHVRVSVQEVEPARVFAYRWRHPENAAAMEGNSLLVEFTLIPERDGTRLRVTESGLDSMSWPTEEQDEYADQHNQGWSTYFGRLREHLGRQSAVPAR